MLSSSRRICEEGKEEVERIGVKVFSAFETDNEIIGKWLDEV